jgi:cyclopropane fatty-acyl-phospholipid synthase-like methyltransferase
MNNDCWVKYWTDKKIIASGNHQSQVGRSINKVPILDESWAYTLEFIERQIDLTMEDELLDLCAGNGLISIPFSKKCNHVVSVDISKDLIDQIDTSTNTNIKIILSDIRLLDLSEESFSKVIFYFAIQHFSEREVIYLFEKVCKWLRPGGLFFVGDIPDSEKIWSFFNTQERQKVYLESIKNDTPIIGTWFSKEFLCKAASYAGFSDCTHIVQPDELINHHYRFDLLIRK